MVWVGFEDLWSHFPFGFWSLFGPEPHPIVEVLLGTILSVQLLSPLNASILGRRSAMRKGFDMKSSFEVR